MSGETPAGWNGRWVFSVLMGGMLFASCANFQGGNLGFFTPMASASDGFEVASPSAFGADSDTVTSDPLLGFAQDCRDLAGTWDFVTTVTSASRKSAIGVNGFYIFEVAGNCDVELAKTGYKGQTMVSFPPERIQRGRGRLLLGENGWNLRVDLARGGVVDLEMEFQFVFLKGLSGTWSYTGHSFRVADFRGTLVGQRR